MSWTAYAQPGIRSSHAASNIHAALRTLLRGEASGNLNAFMYGASEKAGDEVRGGALFDALCEQPAYYLRNVEARLIENHAAAIAAPFASTTTVVEFGPGSHFAIERKTIPLLRAMPQVRRYVAVDWNLNYLDDAVATLRAALPHLEILPILSSFQDLTALPADGNPLLALMFGNTIGNFDTEAADRFPPEQPIDFIRHIRGLLGEKGWFLVGQDCLEDEAGLLAAYANPAAHAWAENLLYRLIRDAGLEAAPENFTGHALYDRRRFLIQLGIKSRIDQFVRLAGETFKIAADQFLPCFNSYKFPRKVFELIAWKAGFEPIALHTDAPAHMALHTLKADWG